MWKNNNNRQVSKWIVISLSLLVLFASGWLNKNEKVGLLQANENDIEGELVAYDLDPNLMPPDLGQLSAVKFKKTMTYEMGGVAVDTNGSVWSWGYNLYGKSGVQAFGDGTALSTSGSNNGYLGGMKRIEYFDVNNIQIDDISSGYRTNMGLDTNGNVYVWGHGSRGEMGNGTTTTTNRIPAKVSSLPKIVKIFSSNDAGGTSNFALDENNNLWAWGSNGSGQLGLGNITNRSTPVQVNIPGNTAEIMMVASGDSQTHILNADGDIWYSGSGTGGRLGNGSTSNYRNFTKLNKPGGMSRVIDINTGQRNTLALDDNNVVWQWGQVAGRVATESYEAVSTPRRVEIDVNDSLAGFNKGYTPIPQKVFSGRLNYYFVDQYGRPWSWGGGVKFGFGTDTGYQDGNSISKTKAVQLPNIMGDGDTQLKTRDPKLPRYLSNPTSPSGKLPYGRYGGYSFNALHPTIYDHKYMLRDAQGNYLDELGNKYRYNSSNSNGRVDGFFYKLNSSGQMTNETGVPATDPEEKAWIELAGQEMPQIEHISAGYESFVMTDVNGNLYKWGTTGSGTMAWGWDVIDEFDFYPSAQHERNGLYDRYTYEIMYMRGAPRVPQLDITINSELEKIYVQKETDPKETAISVSVKIPPVVKSAQLGLTIESQLHEALAVVMPYDVMDPNMLLEVPTEDDVMAALVNPNYQIIDMMEKENWEKPTKNLSEVDWLELTSDTAIKKNSIVWIVTNHTAYDHNNHFQTVVRRVFDNYYEPIVMTHKGVQENQRSNVIYPENKENITKVTQDGIAKIVGFPLDVNQTIIGTPTSPPTFGYDEVKVSKLSDSQLEAIEANFTKYWQWFTPQTTSKTYKLNGVDKPNNNDLTKATGELAVTDKYSHQFAYAKNPKGFVQIHYIGVDAEGNKIAEFSMPSEEVKKGIDLERTPQDLSGQQLIAKEFKLIDGKPPTNFPTNIENMNGLNNAGNVHFKIPFDDQEKTEKTIVILYMPPFSKLHVRQVVLEQTAKVDLPRQAYFTLVPAKTGVIWEYSQPTTNIFTRSQLVTDQVDYSEYKLMLKNGNLGYGLTYILPQYYEYIGYKLDPDNGEYDPSNPLTDPEIKIDYSSNSEYWVTVYIKPQTKIPDNYMWGTALNDFGKIKIP